MSDEKKDAFPLDSQEWRDSDGILDSEDEHPLDPEKKSDPFLWWILLVILLIGGLLLVVTWSGRRKRDLRGRVN